MERLVIKSKAGSCYLNDAERGLKLEPHEITPHQRRLLLEGLHAYEDTDLTPQEIMELKERDTARAPEPAPLGEGGMVCPSCGKKALPWDRFCGECGQRFWEDE